ncbi:MAG: hypothetical protein ACTTIC_05610 [Helicobacteraceae bacterium]
MKYPTLIFLAAIFLHSAGWQQNTLAKYNQASQTKRVSLITKMNADMSLKRKNGTELEDARLGDVINTDDELTQHYGKSELTLIGGNKINIDGKARLKMEKTGIRWLEGSGNFKLNKPAKIQTRAGQIVSNKADFNLYEAPVAGPRKYIAKKNSVEVKEGTVGIRAPSGAGSFNVRYANNTKEAKMPRFSLKKGQKAVFDGNNVTIFSSNDEPRSDERDGKFKLFVGAGVDLVYLNTDYQNYGNLLHDDKLAPRFSGGVAIITRRIKPIYMLFLSTDRILEELRFSYLYPFKDYFESAPFLSTPYAKLNLGIGVTNGRGFEPTHASAGLGLGALKKIGAITAFADINVNYRKWEFGRAPNELQLQWRQLEITLETRFLYRLRW